MEYQKGEGFICELMRRNIDFLVGLTNIDHCLKYLSCWVFRWVFFLFGDFDNQLKLNRGRENTENQTNISGSDFSNIALKRHESVKMYMRAHSGNTQVFLICGCQLDSIKQ